MAAPMPPVRYTPPPPDNPNSPNVNISHTQPVVEFLKLCGGLLIIMVSCILVANLVIDGLIWAMPATADNILATFVTPLVNSELKQEESTTAKAQHAHQVFQTLTTGLPEQSHYTFHVTQNSTLNAMALPGGHIVLFTGLLNQLENDDELAFVLSHEIGHHQARHHLRNVSKVIVMAVTFSLFQQLEAVSTLSEALFETSMLKFSREDEMEADDYAYARVVATGYNPQKAITFFDRLPEEKHRVLGDIFSTHPNTPERKARLQKRLKTHLSQAH